MTALYVAADHGQWEVVDLLLVKGADINEKNKNGFTALHLAVEGGHKEIVMLLLLEGALWSYWWQKGLM